MIANWRWKMCCGRCYRNDTPQAIVSHAKLFGGAGTMQDGSVNGRQAHRGLSRRRLLQIGGLGLLGSLLPDLLQAGEGRRRARAKSVIFLHQYGGPSHLDTFDMKPDAPAAIRGDYRPIATRAPGIQICEHLPALAPHMDKVTLIRTLWHGMRNHNSAGY